jgi:hypothetical protein
LGFENEQFREHILKLQRTGYGLTLMEIRRTAYKFVQKMAFTVNLMLRNVWQRGKLKNSRNWQWAAAVLTEVVLREKMRMNTAKSAEVTIMIQITNILRITQQD